MDERPDDVVGNGGADGQETDGTVSGKTEDELKFEYAMTYDTKLSVPHYAMRETRLKAVTDGSSFHDDGGIRKVQRKLETDFELKTEDMIFESGNFAEDILMADDTLRRRNVSFDSKAVAKLVFGGVTYDLVME